MEDHESEGVGHRRERNLFLPLPGHRCLDHDGSDPRQIEGQ
jgi:hypothetical protein